MDYTIYWEKQGMDMLCGVHCINSLLQGPFFDEVTLAHFALELDKKERELMMEQGMTKDFLKYMGEDSGNVAMDGNYSVQVLQEALKTLNLSMRSIETIKEGNDLGQKTGFICNSAAHWFSLRKINKTWYNLNSTNKRMPEIISDFYLSAFLQAVKSSGYQLFSVEGEYPESSEERFEYYNKNQMWISARRIEKYHQKCIKRKGFRPNIGDGRGDKQMQKAMALSLGKPFEEYISSGEDSDWDNDKPKKPQLKEFGGMGASMGEEVFVNYSKFQMHEDDVQMAMFMKQSLEDQFRKEPEEGKLVVLRYPNGKKEQRIFPDNADIETVYDYVWHKRSANSRFYLTNFESKEKLVDVTIPLFAIVDQDNTAIIIVNDQ